MNTPQFSYNLPEATISFSIKGRKDILSSHLELRRIQLEEWLENHYIAESKDRQKEYKLIVEQKALKQLVKFGEVEALISFQRTQRGNYAVARLWEPKK